MAQVNDAVKEEGQCQAIKYLFEMIGLCLAIANDDEAQRSLAQTLLDQLGLDADIEEKPAKSRNGVIP